MKKHISSLSLSLLLVPMHSYTMEKFEQRDISEQHVQTLTDPRANTHYQNPPNSPYNVQTLTDPHANTHYQTPPKSPYSDSLERSVITDQTNKTVIEDSPGMLTRLFQSAYYNEITLALNYTKGLTQKPATPVDTANKVNRGITKTIKDASNNRKNYDLTKVDDLLKVTRDHNVHTDNLYTMISPCAEFDISLNKDGLTAAYQHLKLEDMQDLALVKKILEEAQMRLQKRKKLRETIFNMNRKRIGSISSDTFDPVSICAHILTDTPEDQQWIYQTLTQGLSK